MMNENPSPNGLALEYRICTSQIDGPQDEVSKCRRLLPTVIIDGRPSVSVADISVRNACRLGPSPSSVHQFKCVNFLL